VHAALSAERSRSNSANVRADDPHSFEVLCSVCMASTATRAPVSPQDYLAIERAAETKHELWRGEVFAMAGASFAHNRIVANLLAELRDALANGPCVALPSDMKLHVPSRDGFVYPDASIVCGSPEFFDATNDVLTNPSAVFEVLSDSTERFDRGAKFVGYRSIPSLRECVLISQHERRVEHYTRSDDGTWVLHEIEGEGRVAPALGGALELAALYRDTGT
jgi:Uma2 family endonuclease